VLGDQKTSYNRELQGVIYSVMNAIPEKQNNIWIDNAAVISLGEKITEKETINWKKQPQPILERLLQEKIIHKIQRDKTKIKFKKIRT
jgi:hypothetical protein